MAELESLKQVVNQLSPRWNLVDEPLGYCLAAKNFTTGKLDRGEKSCFVVVGLSTSEDGTQSERKIVQEGIVLDVDVVNRDARGIGLHCIGDDADAMVFEDSI